MSSYLPTFLYNPARKWSDLNPFAAAPAATTGSANTQSVATDTSSTGQPPKLGGRHRTYRKKSKSKRRRVGRKSTRR